MGLENVIGKQDQNMELGNSTDQWESVRLPQLPFPGQCRVSQLVINNMMLLSDVQHL